MFRASHGTARVVNDTLEVQLDSKDYKETDSKLTLYVYQYQRTGKNKEEERPTELEKTYKFELFVVKEKIIGVEEAKTGGYTNLDHSVLNGHKISPLLSRDIAVHASEEGVNLAAARPNRELLIPSSENRCNLLLRIKESMPPTVHKVLKLENINAFRDHYFSLVVDTPFKTLKQAQPCQVLVGQSFPETQLAPDVV